MTPVQFEPGLYVAATPIGHLADITDRVRQGLVACNHLYAEDTRRAQMLLSGLGIHRDRNTLHALHEHNEEVVAEQILLHLAAGQSVMLISDAGTPAISDPGFRVVRAAWDHGHRVVPLPGASALTAALSICGFARWPIAFWGFAPTKASARREWLAQIKAVGGLAVIYEAPHRAQACLEDCAALLGGDTPMLFGRELTKQFETVFRGSITQVQEMISQHQAQDAKSIKGEMVWVFDIAKEPGLVSQEDQSAALAQWAAALAAEMPAANAAKCLAKMLQVPRDIAYAAVLAARRS
jgi:16S rRNA (cytidine1402-2'-O)-methyltransferase